MCNHHDDDGIRDALHDITDECCMGCRNTPRSVMLYECEMKREYMLADEYTMCVHLINAHFDECNHDDGSYACQRQDGDDANSWRYYMGPPALRAANERSALDGWQIQPFIKGPRPVD
jgi:hypothetical protein